MARENVLLVLFSLTCILFTQAQMVHDESHVTGRVKRDSDGNKEMNNFPFGGGPHKNQWIFNDEFGQVNITGDIKTSGFGNTGNKIGHTVTGPTGSVTVGQDHISMTIPTDRDFEKNINDCIKVVNKMNSKESSTLTIHYMCSSCGSWNSSKVFANIIMIIAVYKIFM